MDFPKCKAQKEFEDLAKELVNVLAEMTEKEQIDIFEYVQNVAYNKKKENKKQ